MELFGVSLELGTIGTIIALGTSLSSLVFGIVQYRGKKKAQELLNDEKKLNNIQLIGELYNDIIDDIKLGIKFRSEIFKLQVEYCEENFEGFIRFIKSKKDVKK